MGGGGKGEGGRRGRTPRLFDVAVASTPACAAPGAVCAPPSERAAEYCEFRRDLALGDSGKDVACLQRYLEAEECYEGTARGGDEAAAELAAEALAAAPGGVAPRDARRRGRRSGATGTFDERTRAAVVRWQRSHDVSPCSGYFGEVSRARYRLKNLRTKELAGAKIALDVGHGAHPLGFEVGVRHGDLTELDLNRAMCYELKTLLENHGASVQMFEYPRGSRNAPWLPERGRRAKGHDVFISCHHNGHNGGSQGSETLVDVDATERDLSLAHTVQASLVSSLGLPDRGVKWQDLGVLGGVTRDVGAAVLVEAYFMDAPPQATHERSRAAGEGVANGVREYWRQHRRRQYVVRVEYDGEGELKRLVRHAPKAWCLRHRGAEHEGCKEVQAVVVDSAVEAERLAAELGAAGFRSPSVGVDDV